MLQKLLFLGLFLLFLTPITSQNAVYKIEFISNWSSSTHPNQYPSSSAHWSPLVGASHNNYISFFNIGELSTDGVEQVAETGGTSTIEAEVNAAISNNSSYKLIKGTGLGSGPGTITINDVEINMDYPLISLITMIAPSPDWVAQINSVKLTDDSNDFKQEISLDVYASDAGTDNETTYDPSNGDDDTNPAVNMFSLQDAAPFSNQIIGTFKFTLQSVLSTDDNELERLVSVYPNPSNGTIFFKIKSSKTVKNVEIFSVNGQKVKSFNNFSEQNGLDITSLQRGMYFLKILSDHSKIIKKIIVQ